MGVRVVHDIGDLARDLDAIKKRVPPEMRAVVGESARAGNTIAKGYARTNNGPNSHARKYPGTFSAEMTKGYAGATASIYTAEYGPRHTGQGQLAGILEDGKGHNAPQNNLRNSADIAGRLLQFKVNKRVGAWFW